MRELMKVTFTVRLVATDQGTWYNQGYYGRNINSSDMNSAEMTANGKRKIVMGNAWEHKRRYDNNASLFRRNYNNICRDKRRGDLRYTILAKREGSEDGSEDTRKGRSVEAEHGKDSNEDRKAGKQNQGFR